MIASIVKSRVCAGFVATSMVLVGCTGENGTGSRSAPLNSAVASSEKRTPAQEKLDQRQREYSDARRQNASAAFGAAAGLGVAHALCQGNDCGIEEYLFGALLGGIAGYQVGNYLNRSNRDFEASQEALKDDIEISRKHSEELRKNVAAVREVVKEQTARMNKLDQRSSATRANNEAYQKALTSIQLDIRRTDQLRVESEKDIVALQERIAAYKKQGVDPGELQDELVLQRKKATELRDLQNILMEMEQSGTRSKSAKNKTSETGPAAQVKFEQRTQFMIG